MLCEAHRRAERGTDVVVGLVETHGRAKTAKMIEGLEVVPRRTVVLPRRRADRAGRRRGARPRPAGGAGRRARPHQRPGLAARQALAGRRGPARGRDHRADHGEHPAPRVAQRRDRADHRRAPAGDRPRRGGAPRRADRAGRHHPRGAAPPDGPRQRLRRRSGSTRRWPTTSSRATSPRCGRWRCSGWPTRSRSPCSGTAPTSRSPTSGRPASGSSSPSPADRRARRCCAAPPASPNASGSADLFAVHVLRGDGLAGAPVGAVAGLRRLAEDVGASFHTVVGDDVPDGLLEFARGVDATQLVIGTSRRSRLARVLVESIGARVVQDSGHIDVHMVTHPEAGRGIRLPRRLSAVPATRRAAGWALSLLLPLTAVGIGILGRGLLGLSTDVVLFFLATVIAALVGGLGPALLAAVAGGLLLNFFLTPPLYTFTIAERENVITLVAMVLVAVLVALVVDRAARRAQQAAQARPRPPCSPRSRAPCSPAATRCPGCWRRSGRRSASRRWRSWSARRAGWTVSASRRDRRGAPAPRTPTSTSRSTSTPTSSVRAARWPPPTAGCSRPSRARPCWRCATSRSQPRRPRRSAAPTPPSCAPRCCRPSATTCAPRWPRSRPRPGSLRDPNLRLSEHDRGELAATVEESADRLTGAGRQPARLLPARHRRRHPAAAAGRLRRGGAARAARPRRRGPRPDRDRRASCPEVLADPGLLERVVANVVDNALRHGRGAPVALRASAHADRVELRVVDAGPGRAARRDGPAVRPVPAARRPRRRAGSASG